MDKKINIDLLTALCKRRGFIFPSSEIYGGLAGVYDYGHYGTLLKNNIRDLWWKNMVLERSDVVGLDSAIFMHQKTWQASGHVDSFSDPQLDCRTCKNRIRADHLLEKFGYDVDKFPINEVNDILNKLKSEHKIKCDKCGGEYLTEARDFNLLVKTNFGSPVGDLKSLHEEDIVYPRGETCQGIYLNYKNIIDSMRVKLPFGIAQTGKAFRNEIVTRQFVFRTREFEQLEMQYFGRPEDMDAKYEYWKQERMRWYTDILGIPASELKFKPHTKLVFYAKAATDIQYNFKSMNGFDEIEGIHQRSDYDLTQHSKFSGVKLDYFDQESNSRFIPHIMETSAGLTRIVFAVIDNAYTEEDLGEGKSRVVLKFSYAVAPVKAAVFPLQKDEKLRSVAENIYNDLKKKLVIEFDDAGNIGKMYRRQDEIGTPYCITVDYKTLEDNTVTVRDRDTMKQERVAIDELFQRVNH